MRRMKICRPFNSTQLVPSRLKSVAETVVIAGNVLSSAGGNLNSNIRVDDVASEPFSETEHRFASSLECKPDGFQKKSARQECAADQLSLLSEQPPTSMSQHRFRAPGDFPDGNVSVTGRRNASMAPDTSVVPNASNISTAEKLTKESISTEFVAETNLLTITNAEMPITRLNEGEDIVVTIDTAVPKFNLFAQLNLLDLATDPDVTIPPGEPVAEPGANILERAWMSVKQRLNKLVTFHKGRPIPPHERRKWEDHLLRFRNATTRREQQAILASAVAEVPYYAFSGMLWYLRCDEDPESIFCKTTEAAFWHGKSKYLRLRNHNMLLRAEKGELVPWPPSCNTFMEGGLIYFAPAGGEPETLTVLKELSFKMSADPSAAAAAAVNNDANPAAADGSDEEFKYVLKNVMWVSDNNKLHISSPSALRQWETDDKKALTFDKRAARILWVRYEPQGSTRGYWNDFSFESGGITRNLGCFVESRLVDPHYIREVCGWSVDFGKNLCELDHDDAVAIMRQNEYSKYTKQLE